MFLLRKPTETAAFALIDTSRGAKFSYPEPECTRHGCPPGYVHDRYRIRLGAGEDVYNRACRGLQQWAMFPRDRAAVFSRTSSLHDGLTMAVAVRCWGVWLLNPCRVVFVEEETGPRRRFAFAYGTLPGHVERGEERFEVLWDQADGSVWFEVNAMSRPANPLMWLVYPLARREQRRFVRHMLQTMLKAVSEVDQHVTIQSG